MEPTWRPTSRGEEGVGGGWCAQVESQPLYPSSDRLELLITGRNLVLRVLRGWWGVGFKGKMKHLEFRCALTLRPLTRSSDHLVLELLTPPPPPSASHPNAQVTTARLDKVFVSVHYHSRDERNPIKKSVIFTLQRSSWMCCYHV